jgi:hypothetical protein
MILFLAVFLADVGITVHSFRGIRFIDELDRGLLKAVAVALPFILVRTLFSVLCAFLGKPKYFSSWSLRWMAILIHGLMGVLMEIICVGIFVVAGLKAKPSPKRASSARKVGPATYQFNEAAPPTQVEHGAVKAEEE